MDPTDRERLIAARQALGLNSRQFGTLLRTPRQTIEQWEKGQRRTPGIAVVAAEALAFRAFRADEIVDLLDEAMTIPEIATASAALHHERCGAAWRQTTEKLIAEMVSAGRLVRRPPIGRGLVRFVRAAS